MEKRISQTYRILCSIQIFKKTVKTNPITKSLMRDEKDLSGSGYNDEVINNIVKRMKTILKTPEFVLCAQDEELVMQHTNENDPDQEDQYNDYIYFIAKGRCKVTIRDKFTDRSEEKIVNILEQDMHFGVSNIIFHI